MNRNDGTAEAAVAEWWRTDIFDFEPGRIWLEDGVPVHAESEKQVGFNAALAIVGASHGRFRFEPQASTPERSVQASVTELLLEASRLMDESAQ